MISPDKYDLIFWDFDGVIKESVSVKTDAYLELFRPYGSDVCKQVKNHHLANGGMSRFDKIPLYLKWADLEQNWVSAYGEKLLLKPGTTLSADIKLGQRSLIEWLLEPLYSIKGRL